MEIISTKKQNNLKSFEDMTAPNMENENNLRNSVINFNAGPSKIDQSVSFKFF